MDLPLRWIRIINPLVAGLLRSGMHAWVSRDILLLTFTGRKSGKSYTTPLSYIRKGGTVYCFTHSPWWRNFREPSRVELLMQGAWLPGTALATAADPEAIEEPLRQFVIRVPRDARFYDLKLDREGRPDPRDLKRAAADAVMIRVELDLGDEPVP
jgi:deazaflavin-dependent oxidoreductase (nitroreductase family)